MTGLAFSAASMQACFDALAQRAERHAQDAQFRMDILYGFAAVAPGRETSQRVRVTVDRSSCLSCGANQSTVVKGRTCCAYCGSDR